MAEAGSNFSLAVRLPHGNTRSGLGFDTRGSSASWAGRRGSGKKKLQNELGHALPIQLDRRFGRFNLGSGAPGFFPTGRFPEEIACFTYFGTLTSRPSGRQKSRPTVCGY